MREIERIFPRTIEGREIGKVLDRLVAKKLVIIKWKSCLAMEPNQEVIFTYFELYDRRDKAINVLDFLKYMSNDEQWLILTNIDKFII